MKKQLFYNPFFYAICTVVVWSLGASLLKLVLSEHHQFTINLSLFFGGITLLFIAKREYKAPFYYLLKSLPYYYYFLGIFGYFVYFYCLDQCFQSYENRISEPIALNYTWPIFSLFLVKILFIKTFNVKKLIVELSGFIFCSVGVFLLATHGTWEFDTANWKGMVWGLSAGLSYGIYSAFSYKVPPDKVTLFTLVSIIISLILNLIFTNAIEISTFKEITLREVVLTLIFGVFIDGIGYWCWGKAKSLADDRNIGKIISIIFFLPIFSMTFIFLIFKEGNFQEPWFIVSFLLIFLGSGICQQADNILNRIYSHNI
jgi:drug/metabolite transporter (DMT)-like permease